MATFRWTSNTQGGVYTPNATQEQLELANFLDNIYGVELLVDNDDLIRAKGRVDYGYEITVDYFLTSRSYYSVTGNRFTLDATYNGSDYVQASVDGSISTDGYSTWGYVNKETYIFSDGSNLTYEGSYDISRIYTSNTSYSFRKNHEYLTGGNDYFYGTNQNDELHSGFGDDVIFGNNGNDTLYGNSGNDGIQGNDGNDKIFGGSGSDSITPGRGNDEVDGGSGVDEVWFSGKSSDYQFSGTSSYLTVQDISSGSNDGTNILKNIENLRFSDGLLTTNEALTPSATSRELQQLYIAYFSRPSDPTGLDYWTNEGISRSAFAANMYLQPEFNNVNGGLSIEAQVNQIYLNLFNRAADTTGLTYWAQQIRNGVLQLASIANDLIWAAENNPGGSSDASILANKTNAAVAYTAQIRTSISSILNYQAQSTNPWITGFNLTEAKNYISEIGQYTTHTSSSINSSIAKFISLSSSTNSSLLLDTAQSNLDSITGLSRDTLSNDFLENLQDSEQAAAENNSYLADRQLNNNNQLNYVAISDHLSNSEYIVNLYDHVLNREADSDGLNYWVGQLETGMESRFEVLLGFSGSAENNALFTDMTGFG